MIGSEPAIAGDVFNARDLSPQEVATSFVISPHFLRLISNAHCVLEGPRGSGKTTLLRMLTPETFAVWSAANPNYTMPFIGVFVPADVRWAKQLTSRLAHVPDPLARTAIQEAFFSVAVSLSFADAIERCGRLWNQYGTQHPETFFQLERETESSIVDALAGLWRITVGVKSFNGLRLALRHRQSELGTLALILAAGESLGKLAVDHPYLGNGWLQNIVSAIETVNELLDRPEQRWAVLLDELEIIPSELLKVVVMALRSTIPNLRLKLALSPAGSDLIANIDPAAPTPGNDYRPIPLWYKDRADARKFSEALFHHALVRMRAISPDQSLGSVLGSSVATDDSGDSNQDAKLAIESPSHVHRERVTAFVSLYEKDESFRKILDDKGILPANVPTQDSAEYGTFVRKITQLVIFRDREIEKFDPETSRCRRKGGPRGYGPYTGYPNLVDLTEGNPRWILTLAEALKARGAEGDTIGARGVQTAAVEEFVRQFVSKLKVYPTRGAGPGQRWTPFDFIQELGKHLEDVLYGGTFSSDPSLSFRIDRRAWDQYHDYIKVCVDLGALVLMRGEASASLESGGDGASLLDARVRISYRLAPQFRLPLKSTKDGAMSTALKGGDLLSPDKATRSTTQKTEDRQIPNSTPIQGRLL
jgi:hypothetical protein